MVRPLYSVLVAAASFGAALTASSVAHATTTQLSGSCSFETDCSAECTPQTINCATEYTDTCSKSCTDTVTDSCTTACDKECTTTPASFSCSAYCSAQCSSTCSANDNCGASSSTDCETDCQAQCGYTCTETPASTTCSTECATSCKAVDNIKCAVSCQVTSSKSCTVTPASCMASCSGTGGVILCNGQVVYVADNIADAASWYVEHWDAQFSLSVMASGGCTGDQCTATVTTTSSGTKCSASPLANSTGNWGLALGGLSFVIAGVARRRNRRS